MVTENGLFPPSYSLLKEVDVAIDLLPAKKIIYCYMCGNPLDYGLNHAGRKFIHCKHCGFHWPNPHI